MASDLEKKIIQQLEYYFGDINLPRDKFLKEKIKEDEGWVALEVLLTFKRLAKLTTDHEVITNAIEKSENKLLEVSEDKKKIRRNPEKPVPEMDENHRKELMTRTAYVKGFPSDETLDNIITFLEEYGPPESCIYRKTPDGKFKGSCFVIFKTVEECKKFVELESVKYKETELVRKWQSDYVAQKKSEYEERKKAKKEKKESKTDEKIEKVLEFPKGAVIHFTGLAAENTITREEIKEAVKEIGPEEIRYIDFNKGDLEGYIRFSKENEASDFFKNVMEGELPVGAELKLKVRVLEGEEEEEFLKKTSESVLKMRQKQKEGGHRKRKGNFKHSFGGKHKNRS